MVGSAYSSNVTSSSSGTALTLYVTKTRSGNTALMSTSSGSAATPTHNANLTIRTPKWCELALGATATGGHTTEPAPSGHGAVWTSNTLAGHHIVAGHWEITLHLRTRGGATTPSVDGTLHARLYVTVLGTKTQIGSDLVAAVSLTNTFLAVTLSGTLPQATFPTGGKLYFDLVLYARGGTTDIVVVSVGAALCEVTTPGYV